MATEHELYMAQALQLAREAFDAGEVPVGCVIVQNGAVVGRGRNRTEEQGNPLAHAELLAITDACRKLGAQRLTHCSLYVTLEPCPMCGGGIVSARIPKIYFGAKEPDSGSCGSVLNLFEEDFPHHPQIVGGILGGDCAALLSDFFLRLRKSKP
jgi:tRNA(adenine34) deaminase